MIRWLSQLWVSSAIDRGGSPPKLWCWTFGRLASHRAFASQLRQLDAQLKRQATSQQRAIARERWPIGDYPAQQTGTEAVSDDRSSERVTGWTFGLPRPAMVAGLCTVLAVMAWLAWPTPSIQSPDELRDATARSFAKVWNPLSSQAQATSNALREQTTHITQLPERLPKIDQVVLDLSATIETPIREEMRRFAHDMTRPWSHLANQLPRPAFRESSEPSRG